MRVALLTGLLLAVLLAGCSDADDAADAADAAVDDFQSTPDPTDPVFETVTRTVEARTHWNGTTKEGAFVCTGSDGTGNCPAGSQIQPDGQHTTILPYAGAFQEALLTVSWTPVDATQTGLVLAVYGPSGLLGTVEGAGDLEFAVTDATLPADGNLSLAVWPQAKAAPGPGVFVDATRQPFHLVADVTTTTQETVEVPPLDA